MANTSRNSFNESANYDKVIQQQGMPYTDYDYNEAQDIFRTKLRRVVYEVFGDGCLGTGWQVQAQSPATMTVNILSGSLYLNGYRVNTTSNQTVTIAAAPTSGTRTDTIYVHVHEVEINSTQDPNIKASVLTIEPTRRIKIQADLVYLQGSTTIPANTTTDYYLGLATILVGTNVTTITSSAITDTRTVKSSTGNNSTLTGTTTVSGTMSVSGATTLSNTLAVTGASTFTGAATFNGGATLAAGQTFTNNGTISGGTGNFTTLQVGGTNVALTTTLATTSAPGLVQVGSGLSVSNGVLSANVQSIPVATATVLGGVKQGSGVSIAGDGTLSVTPYTLPTASTTVLGGVKVGSGLSIDGTGVLSATQYTLPSDVAKTDVAQSWTAIQTFSTAPSFSSAQGTAPFSVTSNTQVNNLNAQYLGGNSASAFAVVGGTNTFTGAQTFNAGLTVASGQTLTNNGTTTLNGAVTLAAGQTFTNNGTITGGTINASSVPWSGITNIPSDLAKYDAVQTWSAVQTFSSAPSFSAAQGTAPFSVTSTTQVSNLNASYLGGNASSAFALLSGGTFTGGVTFNAGLTIPANQAITNNGASTTTGLATFNGGVTFASGANVTFNGPIIGSSVDTNATANTLAKRDSNGNVATQYPFAVYQNPNLLFNPSFRLGKVGWTAGSSIWQTILGGYGEGGILYNGGGAYVAGTSLSIASQHIPSSANVTFTLSGEVRTSGLTAGNVQLQINAYDASNNFLAQGNVVISTAKDWTKYSCTLTTPANTSYVQVYLWSTNTMAANQYGLGFRKLKLELGNYATTFSDDNTFNTTQYASMIPFVQHTQSRVPFYRGSQNFSTTANTPMNTWAAGMMPFNYHASEWSNSTFVADFQMFYTSTSATAYAGIWDYTVGAAVAGSEVSVTQNGTGNPGTVTPARTAAFTLTDGHTYGFYARSSSTSAIQVTAADLIALF